MKITYDDIYENMKNKFYEECGENVDFMGDIGARFKAIASELYSLYCFGDFIFRQAFIQRATGEFLDAHAQVRGIERKTGERAHITLRFSVSQPAIANIQIPRKTICACVDKPYIQFETLSDAYIPIGGRFVDVEAMALERSEEYNVEIGAVSVMVNPPSFITGVTNVTCGVGGCGNESDEGLRKRILNAYSVPPLGITSASLAEAVERIDEVLECRVDKQGHIINVYVRTADNSVSGELSAVIENALGVAQFMNMVISIIPAQPVEVDINAVFRPDLHADSSAVAAEIEKAIKAGIERSPIGEFFDLKSLTYPCMKIDGVRDIEFKSGSAYDSIICVENNEYLRVRNVEVTPYA